MLRLGGRRRQGFGRFEPGRLRRWQQIDDERIVEQLRCNASGRDEKQPHCRMRTENDAQQAAAPGDGKAGTGLAHVAARHRQCGMGTLQKRRRSEGGRNLRCASGMVSNVLMDRPHSEDDRQCQRQCAFAALCTPQTVCCKRPWFDPGTSNNRPVSGLASDIGPMSSTSPSQTLRARRVRRHVGDQWLVVQKTTGMYLNLLTVAGAAKALQKNYAPCSRLTLNAMAFRAPAAWVR